MNFHLRFVPFFLVLCVQTFTLVSAQSKESLITDGIRDVPNGERIIADIHGDMGDYSAGVVTENAVYVRYFGIGLAEVDYARTAFKAPKGTKIIGIGPRKYKRVGSFFVSQN